MGHDTAQPTSQVHPCVRRGRPPRACPWCPQTQRRPASSAACATAATAPPAAVEVQASPSTDHPKIHIDTHCRSVLRCTECGRMPGTAARRALQGSRLAAHAKTQVTQHAGLPDLRVHVLLVQHEAGEAGGPAGPVPPAPPGAPTAVPRVPLPLPLLRGDLYQPLAGRLQSPAAHKLHVIPMLWHSQL